MHPDRGHQLTDEPFFIVGTERSGSNLLRLILNAHPGLSVPHPPHILRYFTPLVDSYGDLTDGPAFAMLARDVSRLVRLHICPWEIRVEADAIAREAPWRDLFGLYVACNEAYRRFSGKRRWGCKSTFMIDHVEEVLGRFPRARFLYLVRDPRDVAASSKRAVFNPYAPRFTARLWRQQQDRGSALLDALPARTISLVRYEDLLGDTEGTIRRTCDFLGEAFVPDLLRFFDTPDARRCSRLSASWALTSSPIDPANSGKYRKGLSARELSVVEAITGPPMARFGYAPVSPEEALRAVDTGADPLYDRLSEAAMAVRAEVLSLLRDRNHWRRWGRAMFLAYLRCRARIAGPRRSAPHAGTVSRVQGGSRRYGA